MSQPPAPAAEGAAPAQEKRVTFVELFFDLVFVFSLTQVTGMVEHHVTWVGLVQAALVFWLIWWGWTQFTWALNSADTDRNAVRVAVLVGTFVAFLMGVGVDEAFGASALWFAIPYVFVRLTGLSFLFRNGFRGQLRGPILTFAGISLVSMAFVVAGGAAPLPWRYGLWATAILIDLVAAALSTRQKGWGLSPGHFSERHGLFVIIALGESVVVVGLTTAAEPPTSALLLVASGAVVVTCLLWWSYFGWFQEAARQVLARTEDPAQSRMASTAYSLLHYPLVGGVVGIAVAFEEMLLSPDEHLDLAATMALGLGVTLFVGATAMSWLRISGNWLWPRLVLVLALWLGLVVLAPHAPALSLGWAVACLLAVAMIEYRARCGLTAVRRRDAAGR